MLIEETYRGTAEHSDLSDFAYAKLGPPPSCDGFLERAEARAEGNSRAIGRIVEYLRERDNLSLEKAEELILGYSTGSLTEI